MSKDRSKAEFEAKIDEAGHRMMRVLSEYDDQVMFSTTLRLTVVLVSVMTKEGIVTDLEGLEEIINEHRDRLVKLVRGEE